MQYAILIYETPEAFEKRDDGPEGDYVAAWRTYHASLLESGNYVGGEPLTQPDTASTVRMTSGRRRIQDGPYANTKEQLGGFIILELASLDAALEWAARCPAASYGAVEVRPIATKMSRIITSPADSEGEHQ